MDIARIEGATRVLGESQGYRGLAIVDTLFGNEPAMISEWIPSEDERTAIANGKSIFLSVLGTQHPPVLIEVGTGRCPFTKEMDV